MFFDVVALHHGTLWVGAIYHITIQNRHEPLVHLHLVKVHRTKFGDLIYHVNHKMLHDIKKGRREAHLKLGLGL
jgi:hypothetical protein